MSTEAALLEQISKLSGAINRHKAHQQEQPPPTRGYAPRGRYAHQGYRGSSYRPPNPTPRAAPPSKEVVLNGVTYVTDGRNMTRKDGAPTSLSSDGRYPYAIVMDRPAPVPPKLVSTGKGAGPDFITLDSSQTSFKKPISAADLAAKRSRLNNMSLILNNAQAQRNRRRPGMVRPPSEKKQCPHFTRTGICTRGRSCPYLHDSNKVAICPRFLKGDCPSGSDCPLSHDPTPERMPFCLHFANAGRCKNGDACIYPHIHLGANAGICRDFAVTGYCEKGAGCDKKHVRECPDFADKGVCPNSHCRLPHVIRAKHAAQPPVKSNPGHTLATPSVNAAVTAGKRKAGEETLIHDPHESKRRKTDDETASFADEPEFIPLTFAESDGDEQDDDDDEEDDGTEEGLDNNSNTLSISIDEEDTDEDTDEDDFIVDDS